MGVNTRQKGKRVIQEMCDEITEQEEPWHEPGRFPKLQKMESVRSGDRWHAPSEKHWKRQGYDSAEHCREHKIALGWEPFSENKKAMWKNNVWRGPQVTQ